MSLPSINHPTDRPNFSRVDVAGITYWFSYQTCIAFRSSQFGLLIRKNDWSATTGKHLNYIDSNKDIRVPGDVFEQKLSMLTNPHVLTEGF